MKNPLGVDGTVNWMRQISSDATISIWASDLLEIVDTLTSRERSRAERAEAERDAARAEVARLRELLSEAVNWMPHGSKYDGPFILSNLDHDYDPDQHADMLNHIDE